MSKHKLGQRVAKAIQSIMEVSSLACAVRTDVTHSIQLQELSATPCTNPEWRVGPNAIRPEDVILLGLHNISQGSWQPSLGLKRRS